MGRLSREAGGLGEYSDDNANENEPELPYVEPDEPPDDEPEPDDEDEPA